MEKESFQPPPQGKEPWTLVVNKKQKNLRLQSTINSTPSTYEKITIKRNKT